MNNTITKNMDSLSEELHSILHLAETKNGSFNDFIFLEKPQHTKSPNETDIFWTASTIRIEGDEVVKGYAVWEESSLQQNSISSQSSHRPWNKTEPHIIGLEWYNRKSANDLSQVISKISQL